MDDEGLAAAVERELKEETGITVDYLEQLYTFGDDVRRDPRARVVTVAYFALVNPSAFSLVKENQADAQGASWFPMNSLPGLGYDHDLIIRKAKERIQAKLTYEPVGFGLLNKEFLFGDLENLYCTILEKEIDRRNFRKKILGFGIVDETNKIAAKKSGRPAKLFRFNGRKYEKLKKNGFYFDIKFA